MSTTTTTTTNSIKEIFFNHGKIEFHKVKGDFLVHLTTRSIPSKRNMSTLPKVGVIAADLDKNLDIITLFKRVSKVKSNTGWEKVKEITPTVIDYERTTYNRIYYKVQKYIHKDIIKDKECVEVWMEEGHSECTGHELVDFLFYGTDLKNYKPYKSAKDFEAADLLSTPDNQLNSEQLSKKMELETALGLCPF